MKAIVVLFLILLSHGDNVNSAEGHFHYDMTFAAALATGWSWEEALLIASADLGVDENEETASSVEMTRRKPLPHVSPKSLKFHCFSATDDREASKRDDRNEDVKENLAFLEQRANRAIDQARRSIAPVDATQALVAIGVYIHCQQDSWFHSGFGGQWDGHAFERIFAVIFQLPDPDHAAARPAKTERAIDEMLEKLVSFQKHWNGMTSKLTSRDFLPLKRFSTHPRTRKMSSRERAQCDHRLTGRWLYLLLSERDQLMTVPMDSIRRDLSQELPAQCKRVYSQAFAPSDGEHWIEIPLWMSLELDLGGNLLWDSSTAPLSLPIRHLLS